MNKIEIINYESQYQEDYKRLSLEWLNENNLYEDADGQMLDHPKIEVLNKGGFIYLAKINSQIVGTITIIPSDNNSFEILKLGVSKNYQRLGIGRILMEFCIQQSKILNARKIILETNTKLESAIRLYTKLGFKEIVYQNNKYEMSDFKMELLLK
ncbi:ribosomal protein S18 acetylase RimI-like enzyme [Tenacibaculum adriaticum]|uniref:Ribosomal protein S18 acetylase RimI-like enzyme n=1 Tax=Tenacibaculum adriaticum TaxID=413713 RepID=A0A5S5DTG0_9FLAO|nr:GNAT family N-acetyltransferase [Tenacibaculum adriaticum]TYP99220.1 ribosomal protein S18 acetylase RimI-like enzyme [Tenacibaculum adriaticum]